MLEQEIELVDSIMEEIIKFIEEKSKWYRSFGASPEEKFIGSVCVGVLDNLIIDIRKKLQEVCNDTYNAEKGYGNTM